MAAELRYMCFLLRPESGRSCCCCCCCYNSCNPWWCTCWPQLPPPNWDKRAQTSPGWNFFFLKHDVSVAWDVWKKGPNCTCKFAIVCILFIWLLSSLISLVFMMEFLLQLQKMACLWRKKSPPSFLAPPWIFFGGQHGGTGKTMQDSTKSPYRHTFHWSILKVELFVYRRWITFGRFQGAQDPARKNQRETQWEPTSTLLKAAFLKGVLCMDCFSKNVLMECFRGDTSFSLQNSGFSWRSNWEWHGHDLFRHLLWWKWQTLLVCKISPGISWQMVSYRSCPSLTMILNEKAKKQYIIIYILLYVFIGSKLPLFP